LIDTKPCGVGIIPSGTGTETGVTCVCWGEGFFTVWDGTAAFTPGAVGGIPDCTGGYSAPPPPPWPELNGLPLLPPAICGTIPGNCGTMPGNCGTMPGNCGTMPSNCGTMPGNCGTIPGKCGTTGCMTGVAEKPAGRGALSGVNGVLENASGSA
jgi:hypothetical protein